MFKTLYFLGLSVAIINIVYSIDRLFNLFGFYDFAVKAFTNRDAGYNGRNYIIGQHFFDRSLGYLGGLHGQYFAPMMAFAFSFHHSLKDHRHIVWHRLVLLASIIFSSVLTGYVTLMVLLGFLGLNRGLTILKKMKLTVGESLILALLLLITVYFASSIYWFLSVLFDIYGKHGLSAHILFTQLTYVPSIFLSSNLSVILFGGYPSLREIVNNEIYLHTLWFHIGILGLFSYLLGVFGIFYRDKVLVMGMLVFLLSLLHYKVYNTGINRFYVCYLFYLVFTNVSQNKIDEKNSTIL